MIIENLLRQNIKGIKAYSSARDEYKETSDNMIFIDANENPFSSKVNRYPDPHQTEVKNRLAEIKGVGTEHLLLGNGSDEVLDLLFRAFCEPNQDNVITMPPTYGMYSVLADLNAIQIKEVVLNDQFEPQVHEVLSVQNDKSKLLLICSPNNPTANSFNKESVEALITGFKGIVVIDEAYIDFSNDDSWVTRLHEFPNLVVTQTMSKAYGLAGIRLGLCYASELIISVLKKIKPPYNVNQLTQDKVLERLNDITQVQNEVRLILEERNRLCLELQSIPVIRKVYPSDANFILAKVDDADKRYRQLISQGIVVRNRSGQALCDNCLRFTVGTPAENKQLIKILNQLK